MKDTIPGRGWNVEEFSIGLKGIEGERRILKLAKVEESS